MATTILIVEDNEMNLDMLTRRLERKGYEILSAMDGEQGVAKAKAEQPNLILMDLSLPILDGYDATRQLKSDPNTKSIPVIALTAHAMVGDKEKAMGAGCDDYEVKPIEFQRLLEKIEKFITKFEEK